MQFSFLKLKKRRLCTIAHELTHRRFARIFIHKVSRMGLPGSFINVEGGKVFRPTRTKRSGYRV